MRFLVFTAAAAVLAGCASQPMTPEQRAAIMQYTLQQQRIQQQNANGVVDAYTAPMRALPPPVQSVTCTSSTNMGTTTTTCR